jgi:hypothetical protein
MDEGSVQRNEGSGPGFLVTHNALLFITKYYAYNSLKVGYNTTKRSQGPFAPPCTILYVPLDISVILPCTKHYIMLL